MNGGMNGRNHEKNGTHGILKNIKDEIRELTAEAYEAVEANEAMEMEAEEAMETVVDPSKLCIDKLTILNLDLSSVILQLS